MSKYQLKCPGVTIYEIEDFLHFKEDFFKNFIFDQLRLDPHCSRITFL